MVNDCLFCSIASGDAEADIVYEDEHSVAFRDINPQAPQHILIIPRKHIANPNELREEEESLMGHLFIVARDVSEELGFSDRGYRLVMNCGEDAGQEVMHAHLHSLAGRTMEWPPG